MATFDWPKRPFEPEPPMASPDDPIPGLGHTEREINRLALALHELDDLTPGSARAATWGTLWTLLKEHVWPEHADTPLARPDPGNPWPT